MSELLKHNKIRIIVGLIFFLLLINGLLIFSFFSIENRRFKSIQKAQDATNTVLGVTESPKNKLSESNAENFITVFLDDIEFYVPTSSIFQENAEVKIENIFNYSPIHFNSKQPSGFYQGELKCFPNKYDFDIQYSNVRNKVEEALDYDSNIYLNAKDFLKSDDLGIYNSCQKYFKINELLPYQLTDFLERYDLQLEDLYSLNIENDSLTLTLRDIQELGRYITDYRSYASKSFLPSEYEIWSSQVYVFTKYRDGKLLNIDNTVLRFDLWEGQYNYDFFAYDALQNPEFINKKVYDFSNVISVGKTRLPLLVDGLVNPSISNAEGGLYSIHRSIVEPGEEFSYIDEIGAINSYTESGFHIGYGTCNSTTTLFRAALLAGFPITERHGHSFYVESYSWGFKENLVDAAYFPSPRLDFKFINDLEYPIMLTFNIKKDDEYQYHYLEVRTSQQAQPRKVEIGEWRITNKTSKEKYSGSFTRKVYDDKNNLLLSDIFKSSYR